MEMIRISWADDYIWVYNLPNVELLAFIVYVLHDRPCLVECENVTVQTKG